MNRADVTTYLTGLLGELDVSKRTERELHDLAETKSQNILDWIDDEVKKREHLAESKRIEELQDKLMCEDAYKELLSESLVNVNYEIVLEEVKIGLEMYIDRCPEEFPVLEAHCKKCKAIQYDSLSTIPYSDLEKVANSVWQDLEYELDQREQVEETHWSDVDQRNRLERTRG
tara:strand:+ start:1376 stop:1894 length:519 start_codon:yes stop_codon:yes gene_type:complete